MENEPAPVPAGVELPASAGADKPDVAEIEPITYEEAAQ